MAIPSPPAFDRQVILAIVLAVVGCAVILSLSAASSRKEKPQRGYAEAAE